MKKILLAIAAFLMLSAGLGAQEVLCTRNTGIVLDATPGRVPKIDYYGVRPEEADLASLRSQWSNSAEAYPTHNASSENLEALAVRMPDGNLSADLRVVSVHREGWDGGEILTISCRDPKYPLEVDIKYKSYYGQDVIGTWTEIRWNGTRKSKVVLTRFDSGCLPIRRGDVWVSSFGGSWAGEMSLFCQPLGPGVRTVFNKDGIRNSQTSHAEVMISLDGKPQELSGRVIGAALCYPGNFELRFETGDPRYESVHRFYAGINPSNSNYSLAAGETFVTPELVYSWSDEGLSGVSRNFHSWGRKYRLAHGGKVNDILLNSWEGVYFDINEEGMHRMMKDIADMGGELFVMDDGWFGGKYPRKDDHSSLGDWVVDRNKLPGGVGGLVEEARRDGIKFGIWIEPEMANTKSELYEAHPDWIINAPGRDIVQGRGGTQVVLDLSNPAVQDYVFGVFDGIMTANPDIAYIKWDANMSVPSQGSQYLGNQEHLYIEYHRGLAKVLDRIRAKYPDVAIQACASGGGRVNWGILPWFDEFWTSDNTDALQRVYIQWGTSYFFPAEAMAAHIGASPNHTTGREIPLKFRIDVAMSARLGMELQPSAMTQEERDKCRKAIGEYKEIRDVVQLGDLYRIVSPYDGKGLATMLYASPSKDRAVYFWYRTEYFHANTVPAARMAGLDPSRNYRVRELDREGRPLSFEGKLFSGRFLMENGLDIPSANTAPGPHRDFASHVLYLQAE